MKKYRLISFYSNTEAWCSFINISTLVWGNKFLSAVVLKACFVYIFHLHEKILYFYVTPKYPDKYISVGNHFQHKNQMDTYTILVTHLWPVSCRAIFQNGCLFYLRYSQDLSFFSHFSKRMCQVSAASKINKPPFWKIAMH